MDVFNVSYRAAHPRDVLEIAPLIRLAAGEMMDFLLQPLHQQLTVEQILARMIQSETSVLSSQNIEVAYSHGRIIGMANSYPANLDIITEEMQGLFQPESLAIIQAFNNAKVEGSWFLNILAVKSPYQQQGIGTSLLWRTKQKAWESGYSTLSLVTQSDNLTAIRLYQKNGFREVQNLVIPPHPQISDRLSYILMSCDLTI
ncbi:GNAT family N-acetyltransferase [Arthrospira platensis]|jgi:ribosomal protein S18 acetylase RimI-like enzyme|uniref:N-acetyltransferase domain-containing protein n=1 Tax=Limnospira platensis NIES-46 TaxID=1236695 RepID=A0A5M3T897_LIMPL|nr:GNAT family N-acetyltransferase [Arthrospira platensis]KDR58470.1 GCN5 family acetyltransferase [Arthrospira platensis str. Paraca]MBD2670076.1 GNAT family N-acetyltransferase [Arthrospira platensis FACHB-439]MBD2710571.1 GNAT family N-acetyltransferase [Arthrospira platensis FACHB-835]MDT9182647.1 GNAT family N-acetyltransferase [Limnospira sp. PMC 289.06]MDT9294771.1 GNAT family N-acetyltransferase [Arthrospira platensis PCC 7345]MDT9310309.1 GNAT family N-acetyltransferase [Limnospira s